MSNQRFLMRYGVALAVACAAGLLRWLINPLLGQGSPFVTFHVAVAVAAWFGGLGPGLFCLSLCSLLSAYFMVTPTAQIDALTLNDGIRLSVFIAMGGLLVGLAVYFREMRSRERTSRERLHVTLHSIGDGVIATDVEGRVTVINDVAVQLTGYPPEDAIGRPLAEVFRIVDEYTRKPAENPVHRCLRERRAVLLANHTLLISRDGKEYVVEDSAAPIRGPSGDIEGVILVFRDGTARRIDEDARGQLASIVASSADAIVGISPAGNIATWNAGAERLFGYSASLAIGQNAAVLVPPRGQPQWQEFKNRAAAGETLSPFETPLVRRDGGRVFASVAISPIRTTAGEIIGISAICRDISAQKQSERVLIESEERFRTLADNISQFAWMANTEGNVTWFNRRWFEYTGEAAEPALGWGWTERLHPEHRQRVIERLSACLKTGDEWEDTFLLRGADGNHRWFLTRAIPICDAQGNVLRWFGTNTDVTQQRETAEALEEAHRRKDEFLAMLGHELRNPLAGIVTGAQVLSILNLEAEAAEMRDVIARQAGHMARMVDDLLDVSRIARGKMVLKREHLDFHALLVDTARDYSQAGADHACTLRCDSGREPAFVFGDRTRLVQVITNLVHNACKFSDTGTKIELSLEVDPEEGMLELRVRDHGVGMTPETLAQIFTPFHQADNSLDRARGGLGLGLALAKGIVELHGGRINANSAGLGQGTTMIVQLPLARSAPATAEVLAIAPGSKRRVLLVDDRRDAILPVQRMLEHTGHEVASACDGPSGLDTLRTFRPDTVLCDIGLAGTMNGYDFAQAVRSLPGFDRLYLVAVTGYGREEDRRAAQDAGFDHHVTKPISQDQLERILANTPRFR